MEFKQIVLESFLDVLNKDYYDAIDDLDLPFNNSSADLKFDLVSRNIKDKILYHSLNVHYIQTRQSSRKFFLFLDKDTRVLYSIHNCRNLNKLPKYSKALINNFNSDISIQLEFKFDGNIHDENEDIYQEIISKIFMFVDKDIVDSIDRYSIISYYFYKDQLKVLNNVILDKNLFLYKQENWLELESIKLSYYNSSVDNNIEKNKNVKLTNKAINRKINKNNLSIKEKQKRDIENE